MVIEHLVLTLFSCRDSVGPDRGNPVDPGRIETRLKLLETVAAPSLWAQTDRRFGWVVLIHPALSIRHRSRLEAIVTRNGRGWLREFHPRFRTEGVDWLEPYVGGEPDYLLTTRLDDDDALPVDYFAALRADIESAASANLLPPVKIFGTSNIVQWDMIHSRKAPLGWKAGWHRATRITSAGFSVLARYPECRRSILGLAHINAERYMDTGVLLEEPQAAKARHSFATTFEEFGESLESWSAQNTFADLGGTAGPVLVSNHSRNVQAGRVIERKGDSEIVRGAESFPGIAIDWDLAPTCVKRVSPRSWVLAADRVPRKMRQTWRRLRRFLRG